MIAKDLPSTNALSGKLVKPILWYAAWSLHLLYFGRKDIQANSETAIAARAFGEPLFMMFYLNYKKDVPLESLAILRIHGFIEFVTPFFKAVKAAWWVITQVVTIVTLLGWFGLRYSYIGYRDVSFFFPDPSS